jgi:hypothetical protein
MAPRDFFWGGGGFKKKKKNFLNIKKTKNNTKKGTDPAK